MDSLTQAVLGAAVGEATLGRRVGHRAPLWGAILGTLPDLDVIYPFADPVSAFTWHRGPSHSVFVLAALTPLIVWLVLKLHPGTAEQRRGWYRLGRPAGIGRLISPPRRTPSASRWSAAWC